MPKQGTDPPDRWTTSNFAAFPLDVAFNAAVRRPHEGGVISDVTGWPMPAMRSVVRWRPRNLADGRGPNVRWGILVTREAGGLGLMQRDYTTIPLRPVWPGFAINTALYATIAAVPIMLNRLLRYRRCRRRERKGECIWCRYPLRGLHKCPECAGPAIPWRHPVLAGAVKPSRRDPFLRRCR